MSGNLSTTLIISGVLLIIGFSFLIFILPNLLKPVTDLRLGDGIFNATIVSSKADRVKGLSGIKELASNKALLMVFPDEDKWGIYMKDMIIPIDIVWLNNKKEVVFIVKNVSPDESTSVTHYPKTAAKYVIEFPAGTVDSKAIKTNSVAIFKINPQDIK